MPLIEDREDLDLFKFYEFIKSDYDRDLMSIEMEVPFVAAGAGVENLGN